MSTQGYRADDDDDDNDNTENYINNLRDCSSFCNRKTNQSHCQHKTIQMDCIIFVKIVVPTRNASFKL
jgi:hypothetical protein